MLMYIKVSCIFFCQSPIHFDSSYFFWINYTNDLCINCVNNISYAGLLNKTRCNCLYVYVSVYERFLRIIKLFLPQYCCCCCSVIFVKMPQGKWLFKINFKAKKKALSMNDEIVYISIEHMI